MAKRVSEIRDWLEKYYARRHGAFWKGVRMYAFELLDELLEHRKVTDENAVLENVTMKELLNGASNWSEYSYSGSALVYDEEICERLCPPSLVKKKRGGELPPHQDETWLDYQAKALERAGRGVMNAIEGPLWFRKKGANQ